MAVRCKNRNKNTEITHEIGYACDYVKILTALEVGMFIRTPLGIDKIGCFNKENVIGYGFITKALHYLHWHKEDNKFSIDGECFNKEEIKASHKLEDLVEPMDLMYVDISPDDCGGIVVPRVAETLNELKKWKKRFSNGSCILKGVVTWEQLESMSYKVKEE